MAKIHGLLDLGKRGLMANQTAMQTTSHNIANRSVEGFSRQRVEIKSNPAVDEGRLRIGTGANAAGISRANNPWLEKQIEKEGANLSFSEGRAGALQKLEAVFNEQTVKGLNTSITDFFNSFRELANNPESAVARTVVRDNSTNLVHNFKEMNRQIDTVTFDLNKQIESGLREVNAMVKEVASLNEKIMTVEVSGANANDERDRRDLLVKKIAEKVDVSWAEDSSTGMINLTAGQTGILVAGTSSNQLTATVAEGNKTQVGFEMSEGGQLVDITDQFKKGSIGAAIDVRDNMVLDLRTQLESLSYNLATEVNRVHAEGFDRSGNPGLDIFTIPQDGEFTLNDIEVNKALINDPSLIAAAAKPGAVGDATTANVIHSLQFKPLMEDGKYTFDDFYNAKVGQIGIATQRATSNLESQKNIVDQLKNTREAVSGVSLDEEAAKMIEFQKSFEASARVIKMADEMFDTVLNLKRL